MKKIKAVFLDIDGTMVSFKTHVVSQQTKNTIKWLRSIGVKGFCSNR
jgi:haloacid dehalogenase-like hydrolase.